MKTKLFFVVLIVALFAAIAIPALAGNVAKDPAQSAVSAPTRVAQESRLWSGQILNSDGDSPDHAPNIQAPAVVPRESICSSEDDPERRQGGCLE